MRSIFSRVTAGLLGMKRGEWKWKFILVRHSTVYSAALNGRTLPRPSIHEKLIDIIWRIAKIIEYDDIKVYAQTVKREKGKRKTVGQKRETQW